MTVQCQMLPAQFRSILYCYIPGKINTIGPVISIYKPPTSTWQKCKGIERLGKCCSSSILAAALLGEKKKEKKKPKHPAPGYLICEGKQPPHHQLRNSKFTLQFPRRRSHFQKGQIFWFRGFLSLSSVRRRGILFWFCRLFILSLIIHASVKKGSTLFLDYPITYKKAPASFLKAWCCNGLGLWKNGAQVGVGSRLQGRI